MRLFALLILSFAISFSSIAWSAEAPLITPYEDARKYTKTEVGDASLTHAVIYYGKGITEAELQARALTSFGTPTVAMAGGEPGTATLVVNKRSYGKYSDEEISGLLSLAAERAFKEQFGAP